VEVTLENISEFGVLVLGTELGPQQTRTVTVTDPLDWAEIQELIDEGELSVINTETGTEVTTDPTSAKPKWSESVRGRAYVYFSSTVDRGPNLTYPYSWPVWSSTYSKTNPTYLAGGVTTPIPARIKKIHHKFRLLSNISTPTTFRIWRQTKTNDSNQVTNTLLAKIDKTFLGLRNHFFDIEEDDWLVDPVVDVKDVVFVTYSRTTSGSSNTFAVQELRFDFEGV